MFHRILPRARFGLASAAVTAMLVLSTGSVAADTGPVPSGTFTQNGTSADAFSGDCSSNGDGTTTCSQGEVSVFAGKMSDTLSGVTHSKQVCVYFNTYTYDEVTGEPVGDLTYEAGCVVDRRIGSLTVGSKLSSVTLAPTTVSIQAFTCADKGEDCVPGATRDVTVAGTWTGVGPTFFSTYRSKSDDGTCRFDESFKGNSRDASFVGTVDGQNLGSDTFASLQDGKATFRSRCVEV